MKINNGLRSGAIKTDTMTKGCFLLCAAVAMAACMVPGYVLRAQKSSGSEVKLNPVKNDYGKWGFADELGKTVIPHKFHGVDEFHEGLAAVLLSNKYGFIDVRGKLVIPAVYDLEIEVTAHGSGYTGSKIEEVGFKDIRFAGGLAKVVFNGKWGFIDKAGKVVVPFKYDRAGKFSEHGKAIAKHGGELKMVDRNGAESGLSSRWRELPMKIGNEWVIDFTSGIDERGRTFVKAIGTGFVHEHSFRNGSVQSSSATGCICVAKGTEHRPHTMIMDDHFTITFLFPTGDAPESVIFHSAINPEEKVMIVCNDVKRTE